VIPFAGLPNVQVWRVGSHLYGLNNENSDEDFGGVYFNPDEMWSPFVNEYGTETGHNNDSWVHTLHKFAVLLRKGNPNLVDLCFVEPQIKSAVVSRFIHVVKPHVLHQDLVKSFVGYARNQSERGFLYAKRQNADRQAQIEELSYDPKYVSHLFRLMVAAEYILNHHAYYDARKDWLWRPVLMQIKEGHYTKDWLLEKRDMMMSHVLELENEKLGLLPTGEKYVERAHDFFLKELPYFSHTTHRE